MAVTDHGVEQLFRQIIINSNDIGDYYNIERMLTSFIALVLGQVLFYEC